MNLDEVVDEMAKAIGASLANKIGVAFRAEAHRGMCAGSVNYCATPADTKDEVDVMLLVLAKYKADGRTVSFDTDEDCKHFFETLFDVCKFYVERNSRVNLADRLTYEARVYSGGKKGAWMCPIAKNRAFNRLNATLELDKTLPELKKRQKAAVKKPFDIFDGPTVPHKNFIICERCGHPNKVGDGAR